jgi:hypothetical protein
MALILDCGLPIALSMADANAAVESRWACVRTARSILLRQQAQK